jgi:hypothetical protein
MTQIIVGTADPLVGRQISSPVPVEVYPRHPEHIRKYHRRVFRAGNQTGVHIRKGGRWGLPIRKEGADRQSLPHFPAL